MFCKPLYVYDAHVKKILKLHDALFVGDLNLDGISYDISRNRPYIGGHLAFYFKLNSKLSHKILKIDLNVCCYFHCNRVKQCYAKIKARI